MLHLPADGGPPGIEYGIRGDPTFEAHADLSWGGQRVLTLETNSDIKVDFGVGIRFDTSAPSAVSDQVTAPYFDAHPYAGCYDSETTGHTCEAGITGEAGAKAEVVVNPKLVWDGTKAVAKEVVKEVVVYLVGIGVGAEHLAVEGAEKVKELTCDFTELC